MFNCNACHHKICIIHDGPWHEGETCKEYDHRTFGKQARDQAAHEKTSRATVQSTTKRCPGKNCAYHIEKNEGCDHAPDVTLSSVGSVWLVMMACSVLE